VAKQPTILVCVCGIGVAILGVSIWCSAARTRRRSVVAYEAAAYTKGAVEAVTNAGREAVLVLRGVDVQTDLPFAYLHTEPVASLIANRNISVFQGTYDNADVMRLIRELATDKNSFPVIVVFYPNGAKRVVNSSDVTGEAIRDALEGA
jgi:hypothetical protein